MKQLKVGTHVVIQRGRYAGLGGNILRYRENHKYAIRLKTKTVVFPRERFLSTGELIRPLRRVEQDTSYSAPGLTKRRRT